MSKIFVLYRYQLLPVNTQLSLTYDLNETIRQKNVIFFNALNELRESTQANARKRYRFELARKDHEKMLMVVSRRKQVKIYLEDHSKDHVPSHPPATLFVNNNSEVQILAIENNSECGKASAIVKMLEVRLKEILLKHNLIVKFSPITNEIDFWNFVGVYQGYINKLHFVIITPNMSDISSQLTNDLKMLGKDTQSAETELVISADEQGVLNITEDNTTLKGLVNYVFQGGGAMKAKLRGLKAQFNSNDTRCSVEIDEAELTLPLDELGEILQRKLSEYEGRDG